VESGEVGHLAEDMLVGDFAEDNTTAINGQVAREQKAEGVVAAGAFGIDDGAGGEGHLLGAPEEQGGGGLVEGSKIGAAEQDLFQIIMFRRHK
jgi:hypothetical protein